MLFNYPKVIQELPITSSTVESKMLVYEMYNTQSKIDNDLYVSWKREIRNNRNATRDMFFTTRSPEEFIELALKLRNERVIRILIHTLLGAIGVSKECIKTFLISKDWDKQLAKETWKRKYKNIDDLKDKNFVKSILRMIFYGHQWPIIKLQVQEKFSWSFCKQVMSIDEEVLDKFLLESAYGSFSSKKGNIAQTGVTEIIKEVLKNTNNNLEFGPLKTPIRYSDCNLMRNNVPILVGECSYTNSTSSGLGDKSDAVCSLFEYVKSQGAYTFLFVDGLAWQQRKQDLMKMIKYADIVITAHPEQITKFCGHIVWLCNNVKCK